MGINQSHHCTKWHLWFVFNRLQLSNAFLDITWSKKKHRISYHTFKDKEYNHQTSIWLKFSLLIFLPCFCSLCIYQISPVCSSLSNRHRKENSISMQRTWIMITNSVLILPTVRKMKTIFIVSYRASSSSFCSRFFM